MVDDAALLPGSPPVKPWQQFAIFQAVVWALFVTVVTLPGLRFPEVAWPRVVQWVIAWAACGVATSSAMAAIYVRLPARLLQGLRVFPVIISSSLLSSVVWTLALLALEPLVGREPWAPPQVTTKEQLVFGMVRGFFFFGLWSGTFLVNLLSTRVQRAVEHSARAQALADEAQLRLLRSQINPHFLFNALNSVIGLIGENPRGAQNMVRDVASLLRKALDADARKETSVEQDLELVRLYVKCEQVRFEARLEVAFEIADEAKGLAMPPMLLQPLVENAIKHGMQAAADAPLRVKVCARREGETLVLEVANSGSLSPRESAIMPEPSGIGLRNLTGRLSQLFPGAHRFELTEREGWVVALIALPLRPFQDGR